MRCRCCGVQVEKKKALITLNLYRACSNSCKQDLENGIVYWKRETFENRRNNKDAYLSPELRFQILMRDGFRCVYCGASSNDEVTLHIDHIQPVSKGGKPDPNNLVTSCSRCNLGKKDIVLPPKTCKELLKIMRQARIVEPET